MPFGEIKKEKQFIVLGVSLVLVYLFAFLLWYLTPEKSAKLFSDKLFLSGTFTFCLGSIIAITAKSRRHYYKHIQEKYKTGSKDDAPFDKEQHMRDRHANVGLLVGISGVVGLLSSALFL